MAWCSTPALFHQSSLQAFLSFLVWRRSSCGSPIELICTILHVPTKKALLGDVRSQSQRSQTSIFSAVTTPLVVGKREAPVFSKSPNLTARGPRWFSKRAARFGMAIEI
jgi:hypothetical protein